MNNLFHIIMDEGILCYLEYNTSSEHLCNHENKYNLRDRCKNPRRGMSIKLPYQKLAIKYCSLVKTEEKQGEMAECFNKKRLNKRNECLHFASGHNYPSQIRPLDTISPGVR